MENRLKSKIIQLVNATKDQNLLEQIYNILDNQSNFTESKLFDDLTETQKQDTELSLKESKEEYNLEDHDSVMKDIRKKFGWT
jgi:hypothetical protein